VAWHCRREGTMKKPSQHLIPPRGEVAGEEKSGAETGVRIRSLGTEPLVDRVTDLVQGAAPRGQLAREHRFAHADVAL